MNSILTRGLYGEIVVVDRRIATGQGSYYDFIKKRIGGTQWKNIKRPVEIVVTWLKIKMWLYVLNMIDIHN